MTLKLEDGVTSYNLSFNLANAEGTWYIFLKSQLSHLFVLDSVPMTTVETNDRYTEFSFDIPADLPLEHKNGIYEYTISNGPDTQVGLLKLVCGTGGTDGTVAYQSDNEDRDAPIYFRPSY